MDELSLCVSGAGNRYPGVITLDELIVFLDDNGEVTKGAATKIRRMKGAKITCLAGVQLDCLPEVFGAGSIGRNIISRFTVMATALRLHLCVLCFGFLFLVLVVLGGRGRFGLLGVGRLLWQSLLG
jgi:hypothetical protein